MAGGTPCIPPLEGGLFAGVVVVTFTDTVGCDGGSNGKDPCRDMIGSRAATRAASSGPVLVADWFTSIGTAVFGPQVCCDCTD